MSSKKSKRVPIWRHCEPQVCARCKCLALNYRNVIARQGDCLVGKVLLAMTETYIQQIGNLDIIVLPASLVEARWASNKSAEVSFLSLQMVVRGVLATP